MLLSFVSRKIKEVFMLSKKGGSALATITLLSLVAGIIVAVLFLNMTSIVGSPEKITNLYIAREVGLMLDTSSSISNDVFFKLPFSVQNSSLKINGNTVTVYGENDVQSSRQQFAVTEYYFTRTQAYNLSQKKTIQLSNFTIDKQGENLYVYDAFEPKPGTTIAVSKAPAKSSKLKSQVNIHVQSQKQSFYAVDEEKILERMELLLENTLRQERFSVNESEDPTMTIVLSFISDQTGKIYFGSADTFETKPLAEWIVQTDTKRVPLMQLPIEKSRVSGFAYVEVAFSDEPATVSTLIKDEEKKLITARIVDACSAFYK